jgi:RimJ/RimL family protein N-acetyltransferase
MPLKFRLLTTQDFPLLLKWLAKEHVRQWWNDGDDTLEKVARHYGGEDDTSRFILLESNESEEKPIGYFQYYFAADDSIGIDQFIGEAHYINRGIGQEAIKIFIEMIMRQHHPAQIILDPSPDNARAIRCYVRVGFKHYESSTNEDGTPAYMMRFECRSSANQLAQPDTAAPVNLP